MDAVTPKVKSLFDLATTGEYLRKIGAVSRSMRKAAIADSSGKYPKDIAVIRFEKDVKGAWALLAPDEYMPPEDQLPLIIAEVAGANWPVSALKRGRVLPIELPERYRNVDSENIFEVRSPAHAVGAGDAANTAKEFDHDLIMLLIRVDHGNGKKSYFPLSWYDDNKFHEMEPDGYMPVYGAEQIHENHGKRIAFLHEGPKAARGGQRAANDPKHPWHRELSQGIHLGWLGGAKRYDDTDWKALAGELKRGGIDLVVIVADNDEDGRKALPQISRRLPMKIDHLLFPTTWTPHFDMADKFPADPPMFDDCVIPGTYMTRLLPNPKGKPTPVLTSAALSEWAYIPDHAMYVAMRYPQITYDKERVNALLRPLSDAADTALLIQNAAYASGRPMRLTYDPGKPQGVITEAGGSALNTHRPSAVLPKSGDARPFLKFLEYMFPDEADRKEVMKWLATLIAHPERRMLYGLLFISETQGVGKSTIGRILAEIVGAHNASFPSERDIGAEFNEWLYEKRLAVVNEVYAGASWKAYHALKDIVTEPFVELNRKFQRKIKVPNWIHLIACSNSFRALKIARGDRRWFVPRVTEEGWPRDKFAELWKWLRRDGFGEIVTWARGYGSYVEDGAHAPMSETKLRVIEEGLSDAGKIAVDLAEKVAAADRAVAVTARKVKEHIRAALAFDRLNESDHELFGLMRDAGMTTWDRIKIGPHRETILVNALALAELEAMPEADRNAAVRDLVAKGPPL